MFTNIQNSYSFYSIPIMYIPEKRKAGELSWFLLAWVNKWQCYERGGQPNYLSHGRYLLTQKKYFNISLHTTLCFLIFPPDYKIYINKTTLVIKIYLIPPSKIVHILQSLSHTWIWIICAPYTFPRNSLCNYFYLKSRGRLNVSIQGVEWHF